MRQKPGTPKPMADRVVRDIRRKTRIGNEGILGIRPLIAAIRA